MNQLRLLVLLRDSIHQISSGERKKNQASARHEKIKFLRFEAVLVLSTFSVIGLSKEDPHVEECWYLFASTLRKDDEIETNDCQLQTSDSLKPSSANTDFDQLFKAGKEETGLDWLAPSLANQTFSKEKPIPLRGMKPCFHVPFPAHLDTYYKIYFHSWRTCSYFPLLWLMI